MPSPTAEEIVLSYLGDTFKPGDIISVVRCRIPLQDVFAIAGWMPRDRIPAYYTVVGVSGSTIKAEGEGA